VSRDVFARRSRGDEERGVGEPAGADAAWLAPAAPGRALGPVAMDFLERLRVVGPAFVVFDLNVADAPLPPLTGYSDDVQDVGNPRPEGRFPGNACEHEGGAFMHDAKHIGAGGDACHGPAPSATFKQTEPDLRDALQEAGVIFTAHDAEECPSS
jgi:hypothetical protein